MSNLKSNTEVKYSPLGYNVESILLTNHRGIEIDISNLVVEFSFTESVFTLPVFLNMKVQDSMNVLQDFEFVGQEKVAVSLSRQVFDGGEQEVLKHDFIVTGYPLYGKLTKVYEQAYEISAITSFVYLGQTKNVCKSINATTASEIGKIVKQLDKSVATNIQGTCRSRFNGVLPNQSAMRTCKMLRDMSFDDKKTPYLLYSCIDRIVNVLPYSYINDSSLNPVIKTFWKDNLYRAAVDTIEAYEEKFTRIFTMSSNLKLNKLEQHAAGAFSSHQADFDLSTKSIRGTDYSYKGTLINTKWDAGWGKPMVNTEVNDVRFSTVWSSMNQTGDVADNYQESFIKARQTKIAERELFDSYEHELAIAGDFNLSVGKRIKIYIPKSVDLTDESRDDGDDVYDPVLSGEYIIVGAIHTFNKEYNLRIKVKRNFSTLNLNE
jgi:hypothetical protein